MIRKRLLLLALLAVRRPAAARRAAFAADAGVRIVVPARDIARGETIGESDLTFAKVPGAALMPGTVTNFDAVNGHASRRMLHAGEALRADDLRHPIVVTKGQTVTMTFNAPGVELTAMGRAMGEGGIGDTVTVQNPASFRMISAAVTGARHGRATGPLRRFRPSATARK